MNEDSGGVTSFDQALFMHFAIEMAKGLERIATCVC